MPNYIARCTLWGTVQTGPVFDQLPFLQQQAVVMHEKGHIRGFHAWKRLWWILTFRACTPDFYAMCREQEHEADEYAAQAGHLRGMILLLRRLPGCRDPGYPSPQQRIERLLRHV